MARLILIVLALFTLGAAPPSASGPSASPEDMVGQFYKAYWALKISGGVPEDKDRAQLAPYLTASLTALLADADKAEARYAARTKNEVPPLIEGDLFTSLFEGASGLDAVHCTGDTKTSHCKAELRYQDARSKDIVRWTDEVTLLQSNAGWRIDDIAFGGTWEFMHKGTLRELLKQTVRDADAPLN
jgi:hypothetical protein